MHFKRWHSVALPAAFFVLCLGGLMGVTPERDQRLILALMASGAALGASLWMLLDSHLGRISMAASGFKENVDKLRGEVRSVSERLEQIEQIPPIRKYLEAQAAQRERERIGGLDTPQPGDPTMPEFPPEPFTRSPVR